MTNLGNQAPRSWDYLHRRLAAIERQIQQLMTQRTLESAVIGRGGISIKGGALKLLHAVTSAVLVVLDSAGLHINDGGQIDVNDGGAVELNDGSSLSVNDGGRMKAETPGGVVLFDVNRAGIPDGSGRLNQVIFIRRADGSVAFTMADLGVTPGHTFQQDWAWYDRNAHVIFAEDTVSGQGLAWPLLSLGSFQSNSYPTDTTNSGSFQTLNTLNGFKQQPKVVFNILARMDDPSTAGEVRVQDQDGNVLGGVVAVSAGAYVSFQIGPVSLPGSHGQGITLNLQGRVTSGTGSIGLRGLAAWGQPS